MVLLAEPEEILPDSIAKLKKWLGEETESEENGADHGKAKGKAATAKEKEAVVAS